MKYVPILFSTPMVQAILDGAKTQTRRVVKSKNKLLNYVGVMENSPRFPFWKDEFLGTHIWSTKNGEFLAKGKAQIGDVFWVRETHSFWNDKFLYKADAEMQSSVVKWKPSIFMPKEACRIFLKVTNVRVERLNDISVDDIKNEGVMIAVSSSGKLLFNLNKKHSEISFLNEWGFNQDNKADERDIWMAHWASLWSNVNGRESWDKNPWVWVYDFERIEKPVDFI